MEREISNVSLIAPVLKVINKLRDHRLLEDYATGDSPQLRFDYKMAEAQR